MSELRRLIVAGLVLACLLPVRVASAADVNDGLESTRGLVQMGAVQLALRRIDTLQPAVAAPFPEGTSSGASPEGTSSGAPPKGTSSGAPPKGTSSGARWVEWERLRLQLLMGAGRNEELLKRAEAWPVGLPAGTLADLHALAAEAALALGRYTAARDYAGRALWAPGISVARLRELRLLVIQSYVRELRADDAYRSMLRFQQDHRPLDTAVATGFVNGLLDVGLVKEAVSWLGSLEEGGAAKLRLRLHAGVITPQNAITQARAALSRKDEQQPWWRVLLDAAERQRSGALRIEALEHLLNVKGAPEADARKLWDAYADFANDAANANHLLAGDDVNWLEFAMRRRDTEPTLARAYFAYLARHARAAPERQRAQEQLAASFTAGRLPRTALQIYAAWPGDPAALSMLTRHTLGMLAETVADQELTFRYWQGLSAPDGMSAITWDLRLTAQALRAGNAGVAADTVRRLVSSQAVIPVAQLPEGIMLAQQLADHGLFDGAQALFERTLPQADALQSRLVLSGLARLHEARNQPLLAADYYLRSALRAPKEVPLGGASSPDAAAAEARLQAGLSLSRAGLRDDARAQFEWLLKNAGDPAQIAVARRELGF